MNQSLLDQARAEERIAAVLDFGSGTLSFEKFLELSYEAHERTDNNPATSQLVFDAFEQCCGNLPIDAALAKSIIGYETRWVTRNQDHIAFFGGHLLGVNPVKFLPTDQNTWFDEILQTDAEVLTQALSEFRELNNERIVSSDSMNLSCVWLAHKLLQSDLDKDLKEQAMMSTMLILQYKFFTSRLYILFRYSADPAVAEAMYTELSFKYAIKQYGSWAAVFHARAADIIRKGGLHYERILQFKPDKQIVYMVNDIQGRIREMLKGLYGEHLRVLHSGVRIKSSSMVVEFDGESVLKDTTKSLVQYRRYLDSIISNPPAFIRDELISVILQVMNTAPEKLVRETLTWMSSHYRQQQHSVITPVLDQTLIHAFSYLNEERGFIHAKPDLAVLLSRLKGVYTSSRSTDAHLLKLRVETEKLVVLATQAKSPAVIAGVRTAVLLYLIARTFSMHHYG